MIRQKLRQLGRFLLEIRKHEENVTDLFSVFLPRHYDGAITAIQSLAGLNEAGTGFKTPSLATALGTLLKQAGKLCVTICIKREDRERQVQDFIKLLVEDYPTSISRTALETQATVKRHAKTVLPSLEDIKKLQYHLLDQVRENDAALKKKFSKHVWLKLAKATLISIQLFNRRRPGEIERLYIADYKNYEKNRHYHHWRVFRKFHT